MGDASDDEHWPVARADHVARDAGGLGADRSSVGGPAACGGRDKDDSRSGR